MLRGLAVVLMLFAHSVSFFNSMQHPVLRFVGKYGNTIVFTTFLFVSGAVAYISYMSVSSEKKWKEKKNKILIRSAKLLLTYYLVAFFASIKVFYSEGVSQWPRLVYEILLLVRVPSFSEFLIPFVIYGLLIIPFRKILKFIADNYLVMILTGVLVYLIGVIMYSVRIPAPFVYYTSFLSGYSDWFRFPVLQYFPVFILGAFWGGVTLRSTQANKILTALVVLGALVLGFLTINFSAYSAPTLEVYEVGVFFNRWPPSVNFILFGLMTVFFGYLVIELTRKIDRVGIVKGFFLFLGKEAFSFYVYHIIILYLYRAVFNQKFGNPLIVVALFTLLLVISALIILMASSIRQRVSLKSPKQGFVARVLKSRLALVMIAIVLFFGFIFVINRDRSKGIISFLPTRNRNKAEVEGVFLEESEPFWWDSAFKYSIQVTVTNGSLNDPITVEDNIKMTIDHSALVDSRKSFANGADLRLVHFDSDGYSTVNISVVNANASETEIYFNPSERIVPVASDNDYYLYYGNASLEEEEIDQEFKDVSFSEYEMFFGEEVKAAIRIETLQKWVLRGGGVPEKSAGVLSF